jgi:hypothetical protein
LGYKPWKYVPHPTLLAKNKKKLPKTTTQNKPMKDYKAITREAFMQFFRDEEKLNELSPDDRIEIFSTILLGSSDITKALLEDILKDYNVSNLEVIETRDGEAW